MNIVEILEFYPIEKNDEKEILTGTIRAKLPHVGIHILGIFISKRKDYWHFSLPSRQGIHHETGEPVRYPLVLFEDRDKQRELIDAIRKEGRAFIERWLSETEIPLIFSQAPQQESGGVETPKAQDKPAAPKETVLIEKQKPRPSITAKEWRDPPPQLQLRSVSKFAR